MSADSIEALWALLALLLAGFVVTIIRAPSWTGTSSAEADSLEESEYDFPPPEPVRHEHAPRHAPGRAPAHAQDAMSAMPPAYRAYTPRHIPVQPTSQSTARPKVTGSPPWGPAPRPPDYLGR
ncbi:MAG: hypothetical protein ACLQFR_22580 [Streptosporangiaceae bacterium]